MVEGAWTTVHVTFRPARTGRGPQRWSRGDVTAAAKPQAPRVRRISALIAGRTSAMSPITA